MDTTNTLLMLSWLKVCDNFQGFSSQFYDALFTASPELKQLFHWIAPEDQDRHLRSVIGALVSGDVTTGGLVALGRRYAGQGVRPSHYTVIAQTLLWALEEQLGVSWTLSVRTAWDDILTRTAAVLMLCDRRRLLNTVIETDNLKPFPRRRERDT